MRRFEVLHSILMKYLNCRGHLSDKYDPSESSQCIKICPQKAKHVYDHK